MACHRGHAELRVCAGRGSDAARMGVGGSATTASRWSWGSARGAFELDSVAVGVAQVDRGAVALGAEVVHDGARGDASRGELGADGVGVEGLDAQGEVIEVSRVGAGRATAHL